MEQLVKYLKKEFPGWPYSNSSIIGDFGQPLRGVRPCLVCNEVGPGWLLYRQVFVENGSYGTRDFLCDECSIKVAHLWLHMNVEDQKQILSTASEHMQIELKAVFSQGHTHKWNNMLVTMDEYLGITETLSVDANKAGTIT